MGCEVNVGGGEYNKLELMIKEAACFQFPQLTRWKLSLRSPCIGFSSLFS